MGFFQFPEGPVHPYRNGILPLSGNPRYFRGGHAVYKTHDDDIPVLRVEIQKQLPNDRNLDNVDFHGFRRRFESGFLEFLQGYRLLLAVIVNDAVVKNAIEKRFWIFRKLLLPEAVFPCFHECFLDKLFGPPRFMNPEIRVPVERIRVGIVQFYKFAFLALVHILRRSKIPFITSIHCTRKILEIPFFLKKMRYSETIQYRINNQIQAPEVRVIGETGENLGVFSRDEAIAMAREKGLDLIEITGGVKPPVARIMSFDKFRYQREKEEKKQRLAQKNRDLKGIRITARAAENDLQVKMKKLCEFLEEGYKVEIMLALRGREKANKDWALQKIKKFIAEIPVPYQVTVEPKQGGRGFIAQVVKK